MKQGEEHMTKEREALNLALGALERLACLGNGVRRGSSIGNQIAIDALTAIKEALANHTEDNLEMVAKPEQEPVAIVDANDEGYWADILPDRSVKVGQLLYTAPPQRQPLTDNLLGLLREARKIIRASSSRNLVKDWDARATSAMAAHNIGAKP